jgi:hypothetical protein
LLYNAGFQFKKGFKAETVHSLLEPVPSLIKLSEHNIDHELQYYAEDDFVELYLYSPNMP